MTDRTHARLLYGLGVLMAVSLAAAAIRARYQVPYHDDWDWLVWLTAGPVTLARLFEPHNEHLIPLARLLFWLQYDLEGTTQYLLFGVALVTQFGLGALVIAEIRRRWPADADHRRTAAGLALVCLFFAWQLQSLVFAAAVLFPLVQFLATLAVAAALSASEPGRSRRAWLVVTFGASLAAMHTTTNGLVVPIVLSLVAYARRESLAVRTAHVSMVVLGTATYIALVIVPGEGATLGTGGPLRTIATMVGFFFAFFAPFVTYLSDAAGEAAGVVLVGAGLALTGRVLARRTALTRADHFAAGLMLFALGTAALAAIGRARFGVEQATQSRYATFSLAYAAALVVGGLSWSTRSAWHRRVDRTVRVVALPAAALLLAAHAVTIAIWIAKADNVAAAGLAVTAGVHDDAWLTTLHPETDRIDAASRRLEAAGDLSLVSPEIGRQLIVPPAIVTCGGSLTLRATGPAALRLEGTTPSPAPRGLIVDGTGAVVGLARPAPLVATPAPSRSEVVRAVIARWRRSDASAHRWLGFARAGGMTPYAFVAVDASGRPVCRAGLAAVPRASTRASAASDERHLRRHHGHGEHIGVEGQTGHVDHRADDVPDIEARLDIDAAVGLEHADVHARRHVGGRVSDVDLPTRDVERAAVEGRGLRQAGDAVLRGGVRGRARPRRIGRDRAVVDDATASRLLALHHRDGLLRAEERARQVRVDDRAPDVHVQIFEGDGRRGDAGVVE